MVNIIGYNLSSLENGTTITTILSSINFNSGYWFGGLLLLVLFIMIFAMFKNYDTLAAFTVDSFIVTLIGLLLNGIGLISMSILIYPFILFIISLIAYQWWG